MDISHNRGWIISMNVSIAIRDSCPVSPSTVKIVDNCPDSEEKWRQAAARKNCAVYANQCDEPDRLVYHCVINTFLNETIEVCAYGKTIHLGYCTEYSQTGNLIQQSFKANCSLFSQNPCPNSYNSTEAYKYPGCYDLTKHKKNQTTIGTTQPSYTASTTIPKKNKSSHLKSTWLPMVCSILCAAFVFVCQYFLADT